MTTAHLLGHGKQGHDGALDGVVAGISRSGKDKEAPSVEFTFAAKTIPPEPGPVQMNPLVPDCFSWKTQLDGTYSASSGYSWLLHRSPLPLQVDDGWNWIWKITGPEKVRVLFWLACHNSLPTSAVLHRRGMLSDPSCPRCQQAPECALHALRDCPQSVCLWRELGFTENCFYSNQNVGEWLRSGANSHKFALFVAGTWWIWRKRNAQSVAHEDIPLFKLKLEITHLANLLSASVQANSIQRPVRSFTWHNTNEQATILNVDGSSLGNPGRAGFGGLLRNSDGSWIVGFAGNLGISEILQAELQAIFKGLRLAWDLGYRNVICYSDSLLALDLIGKNLNNFHRYAVLIQSIKDELKKEWFVNLKHNWREANGAADILAKMGAHSSVAWMLVEDLDSVPELRTVLARDASRSLYFRS